jgi:hypothetical protein
MISGLFLDPLHQRASHILGIVTTLIGILIVMLAESILDADLTFGSTSEQIAEGIFQLSCFLCNRQVL